MIELDKHIAGEGARAGAVNAFEATKLRFEPAGTEVLYRGRTDADPAGKTVHDSGIVCDRHLPGSYPIARCVERLRFDLSGSETTSSRW